jgi:hypothetical protein
MPPEASATPVKIRRAVKAGLRRFIEERERRASASVAAIGRVA